VIFFCNQLQVIRILEVINNLLVTNCYLLQECLNAKRTALCVRLSVSNTPVSVILSYRLE